MLHSYKKKYKGGKNHLQCMGVGHRVEIGCRQHSWYFLHMKFH